MAAEDCWNAWKVLLLIHWICKARVQEIDLALSLYMCK
jgi:hypothetical protein